MMPLPDQTSPQRVGIAAAIHYPDCWDQDAYPTLASALAELAAFFRCTNDACASPSAHLRLRPPVVVPEGETPADIRVLRQANIDLAMEAHTLGVALADLLRQVREFCETEGEADFYTGNAIAALHQHNPLEHRKPNPAHIETLSKLLAAAPPIEGQPQPSETYAECYVCGRPMDGLSEDDCHCFHRKELRAPAAVDDRPSRDELISALAACRDAFPMPAIGTALDDAWCEAISDPLAVPDFVRLITSTPTSAPAADAALPAPITQALRDAATSLETIASLAGRKTYGSPPIQTYMDTFMDVRLYAAARAKVAREALSTPQQADKETP